MWTLAVSRIHMDPDTHDYTVSVVQYYSSSTVAVTGSGTTTGTGRPTGSLQYRQSSVSQGVSSVC